MDHELKTWPSAFGPMWRGDKLYELRKDDRGFRIDDELYLREWEPETGTYTGRWIRGVVTYITKPGSFPGLVEGFVILGVRTTSRSG